MEAVHDYGQTSFLSYYISIVYPSDIHRLSIVFMDIQWNDDVFAI